MGACISSPQNDDHRRSQPSSSGSTSHKQTAAPCGGSTGGGAAAASAAAAAAKNGESKLPSLQQQWLALHDTNKEKETGREKKGMGKSTRKVKSMSREAKGEIILAADLELAGQVEGLTGRITESVSSRIGTGDLCCTVHSQQGCKGANQDRALAWQGFLPGVPGAVMCAVFDGHGPCGETIARIARDLLPHRIAHAVACRSPTHMRTPAVAAADAAADLFTELGHHRQLQHRLSLSREEAVRIYPQPTDRGDSRGGEDGESRRISCNYGSSSSNSSGAERSSSRPGAVVAAAESMQQQQQQQWGAIMTEAFAATDADIRLHPGGNPIISGSTAAIIIRQGRTLVVAHLGDSRIVLFRRSGQQQPAKADELASASSAEAAASSSEGAPVSQLSGDSEEGGADARSAARREVLAILTPLLLTDDHKCSVTAEKVRLTAAGARVKAFPDEPHIQRIFLPDQDAPGLAVSRAFGDAMLKRFGVSVEPAVSVRHITDDDVALVAASDGVWDVLSHEDVASIVATSPSGGETAEAIVEAAVAAWARKFPKALRDDCTAAVLFLPPTAEAGGPEELMKPLGNFSFPRASESSSRIPQLKCGGGVCP